MELTQVELHLAFMWDCDHCGAENFCRSVVPTLSEEEEQELQDDHGIQPYEIGKWHTAPSRVLCRECGRKFATDHAPNCE